MGMFFSLREDVLVHEFDGTLEELKEKFDTDKIKQSELMEKQIALQNEKKEKIVRPDDYDDRSASEKTAIDADNAAKIANHDNQIDKIRSMIIFLDRMTFEKQKFFDLEPLLVKEYKMIKIV